MKKYFFSIKMCIIRAVLSKRFLCSFLLVFILNVMDLLPIFLSGVKNIDGEIYYSYSVIDLSMLSGNTMFLGFSFIACVIPYSGMFCDDYESRFIIPFVKRSSGEGYGAGTSAACGFSSFLCVFLAQIACFGFFMLFIPFKGIHDSHMDYSLMAEGKYILFMLARVLVFSLRGAFFALVSLALSAYVKNKYVIFSVPFIMYYFLMKFGYGVLNVPGYLNVLGIYFNFVFGPEYELFSLFYAFIITVITGIIAGGILSHKVRRCL